MIIFVVLLCLLADVCELKNERRMSSDKRDLLNLNREPRDQILVNPIWDEPTTEFVSGVTSRVLLKYSASGSYYMDVAIGTPTKSFKFLLSSSADYTALKSTRCSECEGSLYNGDSSKSVLHWNETSQSITSSAFGCDYVGTMFKDRLEIGGLRAYKVKMLAASSGSKSATKGDHDGILSFKYGTGDRGYFYRLMEVVDLKTSIASFVFLQRRHTRGEGPAGIMWLGTRNPDYFTAPMAYSYVNSPYWVFGIQTFTVDDTELCPKGPCLGHVSFDDELVLIHTTFYTILLDAIKGQRYDDGKIMVDCDRRTSLPPIRFEIGGEKFRLTGSEYVIKESGACFTMFKLDQRIKELEFVMGTYFFEHFYLELGMYKFDHTRSRGVGIAKRKYNIT